MIPADPKILTAAEQLFLSKGFHQVLLSEVATASGVALPAVQMHFSNTTLLLLGLLKYRDPREDFRQALRQLHGATPEEIIRNAIEGLIIVSDQHQAFTRLLMMEVYANNGDYMTEFLQDLMGDAASFINRLSTMSGVRPISTIMMGRALAALLTGFMTTQQLAPPEAQFALKIFPQKAWVDGMTDILLHGILDKNP